MERDKPMLNPQDVAKRMNISVSAARERMEEMPGCIDIGKGKNRVLRVPESGLEAWTSNRVVCISRAMKKTPRRKNGKLIAV